MIIAAATGISSTTALFYKDLEGTSTDTTDETKHKPTFHNKKQRASSYTVTASATPTTTTLTSSAGSTIKQKNKQNKLKNNKKKRSYTLHKQSKQKAGQPIATYEELANHVQSVFSDLKEFEDGSTCSTADGDTEEQLNNNRHYHNGEKTTHTHQQHDMVAMKQNSILLDKHPSLVLNADYQPLRMLPLSIWSWQTTVKAVLSGKAAVVDIYPDLYVRAVSLDIPVPSVIALREYAPTGKAKPAFTRRNVFLRDGYRCQYCSNLFRTSDLSLDHVTPRCLGGKLTWTNTVTCCKKCNGRKGSLLPTQLHVVGMELRSEPQCPSLYELAAEAGRFVPRRVHPMWEPFLGGGGSNR